MDRRTLSNIDEELESSEVAALCFLCRDVINRKRLEGIKDAKGLFSRLDEKCLLENPAFLSQLLQIIRRADLLNLLETDSRQPEETDANPILSDYRVMLYQIYEDITQENLDKMKFLLSNKLGKRQTETCKTALDVFAEMEKTGLLSNTNLDLLHETLLDFDRQLALTVQQHMQGSTQQPQTTTPAHVSMDYRRISYTPQPAQPSLPIADSQRRDAVLSDADAEPPSSYDPEDYYTLSHNPRGVCMVINNEEFPGTDLKKRAGTQQDVDALRNVFTQLGFTMEIHNNLTADDMRTQLRNLSARDFRDHDVLVVCVLSHGEMGCVFGSDEKKVPLQEITQPFTSLRAPSLVGKPKLFFFQACQGSSYQRGSLVRIQGPGHEEDNVESQVEEDAGPLFPETVPSHADFLVGMATVAECRSFRNTSSGSIYIQELCRQLLKYARSPVRDDILSVLLRVNHEVSKGEFKTHKQMPEPKYTLRKKLVLKCV